MDYGMDPNLQVIAFCGPQKESCVGNQTLEDKSCMVSCTGLYADIEDDAAAAMKQNMMKGKILTCFPIVHYIYKTF